MFTAVEALSMFSSYFNILLLSLYTIMTYKEFISQTKKSKLGEEDNKQESLTVCFMAISSHHDWSYIC